MEKCRECNSILKKGERACYLCGSQVERADAGAALGGLMLKTINLLFIISALCCAGHLFLTFNPPFSKCLVATLVLGVVKSSAGQMVEPKKE